MNNKRKKYVGSFNNEKDAALVYDKAAILIHGLKVFTLHDNFIYFLPRLKQISNIQRDRFWIY
jgi:hypothetical protein